MDSPRHWMRSLSSSHSSYSVAVVADFAATGWQVEHSNYSDYNSHQSMQTVGWAVPRESPYVAFGHSVAVTAVVVVVDGALGTSVSVHFVPSPSAAHYVPSVSVHQNRTHSEHSNADCAVHSAPSAEVAVNVKQQSNAVETSEAVDWFEPQTDSTQTVRDLDYLDYLVGVHAARWHVAGQPGNDANRAVQS